MISNIDEMPLELVDAGLAEIERAYTTSIREVDIRRMSENANLYATWRQLREKKRRILAQTKTGSAKGSNDLSKT